ncbi:hypothetical protein [Pseudoduganella violacea]|uniref:Type IV pilus biogenesis protein PilP n=1 Tax=Pseudoduganella violacea TaxID=1715466 RepID=A0A7W5BDP7_9BURK|nr:hypothetical protein [Pseudoduganella violacea]MBB3121224.1 hypothetical protein [Pseudoduganella violacea]
MKRLLLAIGLIPCCGPLLAQATTPNIGRLFTSPEERVQLDAQRSSTPLGAAAGMPGISSGLVAPAPAPAPMAASEAPPLPPAEPVQLNGVIRRSGGKSVVWVNNVPLESPAARVKGGALSVPLPTGGSVKLKPGQSFNPADGSVHEAGR